MGDTVAGPIALALRRKDAPFYLDVLIFAGFMFIGGAVCMALLRHWMTKKKRRRLRSEHLISRMEL